MSAVDGGGNNYMSDSAILAWVTVQQSQQYGRLEDAMDSEKLRGDMASDAAKLKLDMQKATKDPSVYPELNKEIEAFNDKYGSVPEFDDVVSLVNQFADKVAANVDLHDTYKDRKAEYDAAAPPVGDDDPRGPEPQDAGTLNKDDVTDWADSLDKIVDTTNQNEQLGMIRINEIKSTIDHTAEVASQLIKSDNDTTAFTIHNFT